MLSSGSSSQGIFALGLFFIIFMMIAIYSGKKKGLGYKARLPLKCI